MTEGIKFVWGNKLTTATTTTAAGDEADEGKAATNEPIVVSLMEIMEEQSHEEEMSRMELLSAEIGGGGGGDDCQSSLTAATLEELDCSRDFALALELSRDPDCSADEQLALKLQRQFDREDELERKFEASKAATGRRQAVLAPDPYHYYAIGREERQQQQQLTKQQQNRQKREQQKNTRSSINWEEEEEADGDEEEEEDQEELRELATSLLYERQPLPDFPPCGTMKSVMADGSTVLVTKHDPAVSMLKSADKALQLPLALSTGDCSDSRIGGKVLNALRTFGKTESKRQMRCKDKEEKATSGLSVDMKTRLTLLKWINSGQFDRVEEIIATGKESAVLHAILDAEKCAKAPSKTTTAAATESSTSETAATQQPLPSVHHPDEAVQQGETTAQQTHFAIKVYKTTLAGFRNRAEYVKDDFRFKNPRRVMKIWAEKEFLNLKRLKNANIMCPTPIKLSKHVLLMSMVGNTYPAPKLKELDWADDAMKQDAFEQVRQMVVRMYKQCQLVHGDLSEFNLLYHLDTVFVIDLAQAMDISHPSSLCFLHRDIMNVLEFFGRIGCDPLPTPHTFFHEVTDISFDHNKNLFVQVESFERENRNMDLRGAKSSPANYELHLHQMDSTGRADSPSRPYN